jgi:hypothetical protein
MCHHDTAMWVSCLKLLAVVIEARLNLLIWKINRKIAMEVESVKKHHLKNKSKAKSVMNPNKNDAQVQICFITKQQR